MRASQWPPRPRWAKEVLAAEPMWGDDSCRGGDQEGHLRRLTHCLPSVPAQGLSPALGTCPGPSVLLPQSNWGGGVFLTFHSMEWGRYSVISSHLPRLQFEGSLPGPTPKVQYGAQPPLPAPVAVTCVFVWLCLTPVTALSWYPPTQAPPGDRELRAIIPPPAPTQEGPLPTATSRVYYKNKRTESEIGVPQCLR